MIEIIIRAQTQAIVVRGPLASPVLRIAAAGSRIVAIPNVQPPGLPEGELDYSVDGNPLLPEI